MPQIQTQIDKNTRKFRILKIFMHFLSIFRKTWLLRMSKTKNKEKIRCPGGFLEDMKATCVEKMHQIWTAIDKFRFLKLLCNFCVLFERLGGLEC